MQFGTTLPQKIVDRYFVNKEEILHAESEVEVNIGGRPFKVNKHFFDGFDDINLLETVKSLKKPILLLHSAFDKIVDIEHAQKLYVNAYHPKSFISLDKADHLLTQQKDSLYVGELISSWSKRYLPQEEKKSIETLGEQVAGHLNLETDKFTTTIQTKRHSFIADEPISVGGDDYGPSPYELLNAGLAACTVMTLKLYANRKKWDLKEVFVYVTHAKKHVQDMEKSYYLDQIQKKLKFVGDLSEEQQNRLPLDVLYIEHYFRLFILKQRLLKTKDLLQLYWVLCLSSVRFLNHFFALHEVN